MRFAPTIVFILIVARAVIAEPSRTLFVAPNGDDSWSGAFSAPNADRTDGPLATITAARDAIRGLQETERGPIEIQIREGIYRISEPIVFAPEDSGTELVRITYTNFGFDKPVISGGIRITDWERDGNLWVATLDDRISEFSALWVNGEYRSPARTPNTGYLRTAGKAPPIKDDAGKDQPSNFAFKYTPGDIQSWPDIDQAMVVVMHSWDTSFHRIDSVDDEANLVTFTASSGPWAFERWGPGQRYYVEGIRAALDAPGEWYVDRKSNRLYYWPKEGEDPSTTEVVVPQSNALVRFEGDPAEGKFVQNITLRGLSFHHANHVLPPDGMACKQAAYPVSGAIEANGARNCIIEDNEIAHAVTYGMWFREGCSDNIIRKNHVHDLGAGGIRIGIGNNPATENEATLRNSVDNNWIHDGGKKYPAAVGVYIGRASHNTVSHNDISDFFYTGVSVGWSWGYQPSSAHHNVIEYNHIHDLGKYVLSDMGGIYALGLAPGTTLRNNLIHDVYSYNYGGWGIYPDEGSTDLLIENNVVFNTKTGGFHQHYGKENRVRNNIFAFATEYNVMRTREEDHISFYFERNIVIFDNAKPLGSNWKNGNFRNDYNCWWDTAHSTFDFAGKSFADWQAAGADVNSIIEDPLFEDAAARDFALSPESPAIVKLGFKPIDISTIGLYGEADWVNAPKSVIREPVRQPAR